MPADQGSRPRQQWVWMVFLPSVILFTAALGIALYFMKSSGVMATVIAATAAASLLTGVTVRSVVKFLERNPQALFITTLGFKNAGKTTYLTVLFDELRLTESRDFAFLPYGAETPAALTANLELLHTGQWVPKTTESKSVYYQAAVQVAGFGGRRYLLVMPDFPGEESEKIADAEGRPSLLISELFKQAVESDIVFLALDGEIIANGMPADIAHLEDRMMEAVDELAVRKKGWFGGKVSAPVALLFLKVDLLGGIGVLEASEKLPRLVRLCSNRFAHFAAFTVSSVGATEGSSCAPPAKLRPYGVVDPFFWALHKLTTARGRSVSSERSADDPDRVGLIGAPREGIFERRRPS